MSKCCVNCFRDKGIRKNIIPQLSEEVGVCSFCSSKDVIVVDPELLRDYLELVLNAYEASNKGNSPAKVLMDDWLLFEPESYAEQQATNLISAILGDKEAKRRYSKPRKSDGNDNREIWKEFRKELMHKNRFFPRAKIDEERLEQLLSRLITDVDEIPEVWYRARIQSEDTPYNLNEMGPPPQKSARHGRANPAGIPYLYLGSTIETAVSEIRPHTGETACVAEFHVENGLSIVDLRHPRDTVSPFLLADEEEVSMMRDDIAFLEHLGEELRRPVLPQSAAYEYAPSQYLCEFIKKCGYQGVLYGSSVSDGMNLSLFYPDKASSIGMQLHHVKKVVVEVAQASAV